jgi:hypothetical protein
MATYTRNIGEAIPDPSAHVASRILTTKPPTLEQIAEAFELARGDVRSPMDVTMDVFVSSGAQGRDDGHVELVRQPGLDGRRPSPWRYEGPLSVAIGELPEACKESTVATPDGLRKLEGLLLRKHKGVFERVEVHDGVFWPGSESGATGDGFLLEAMITGHSGHASADELLRRATEFEARAVVALAEIQQKKEALAAVSGELRELQATISQKSATIAQLEEAVRKQEASPSDLEKVRDDRLHEHAKELLLLQQEHTEKMAVKTLENQLHIAEIQAASQRFAASVTKKEEEQGRTANRTANKNLVGVIGAALIAAIAGTIGWLAHLPPASTGSAHQASTTPPAVTGAPAASAASPPKALQDASRAAGPTHSKELPPAP